MPSLGPPPPSSGERFVLSKPDLATAFDDFGQDVFRYCVRGVTDRNMAEDLMSVVFLEAWRSRDRAWLVDGSLRPWLLGIAANVVKTSRRSQRRHSAMLATFHAGDRDVLVPDHADAVAAAADAPADRQRIQAALAQLSQRDRVVAQACLVEGLSASAAAVDLHLSESAVKSRLGRARRHLRPLLRTGEFLAETSPRRSGGHQQGERLPGASAGGLNPQETRS